MGAILSAAVLASGGAQADAETAFGAAGATAEASGGAALRTALATAADLPEAAERYYEDAQFSGLWLDPEAGPRRVEALLAALEAAPRHALPAGRYDVAGARAALAAAETGGPAAAARAEVALTSAFLSYARDVSSGLLKPNAVDGDLHVFPARPDSGFLLLGLDAARDPAAFIAGLAPDHPDYETLKAAYARYADLAAEGGWAGASLSGPTIRPGDRHPLVAAARARLTRLGYDAAAAPGRPAELYDAQIELTLRSFQRDSGLNDDGVIGPRTKQALRGSAAWRAGQIAVNLERLRWMNRELGRRHIVVNQADFTVRLVEAGRVLFDQRVVVGKTRRHQTPEFSDEMTHLVFNPSWYVPRSIASREILPELQEDPYYLQRQNMVMTAPSGQAPDPGATDWSLYSANDFPYRIRQRPGADNALGRVKFMFPNRFNIYLHDTPSKHLFEKDVRAFSHGCVRVRDPMRLANLLLNDQTDQPQAMIDRLVRRGHERRVNLDRPVPVHLTYRTAVVDSTGATRFRVDVYGRDRRILSALQTQGVAAPGV